MKTFNVIAGLSSGNELEMFLSLNSVISYITKFGNKLKVILFFLVSAALPME